MQRLWAKHSVDAEIMQKRKESTEGNSTSMDKDMLHFHQLNRAIEEKDILYVSTV